MLKIIIAEGDDEDEILGSGKKFKLYSFPMGGSYIYFRIGFVDGTTISDI